MLTLSGIVIFATLSGESSKDAFWGPIFRFSDRRRQDGAMQNRETGRPSLVSACLSAGRPTAARRLSDAPPAENRTIHPAPPGEFAGFRIPFSKTPENIMYGKGLLLRRSALPATAISTAKGRLPRDSILLRRIFPIRRRSPCFRRAISSGASRRAAWDSRSKVCPGNRRCRDGNVELPDEWYLEDHHGRIRWGASKAADLGIV